MLICGCPKDCGPSPPPPAEVTQKHQNLSGGFTRRKAWSRGGQGDQMGRNTAGLRTMRAQGYGSSWQTHPNPCRYPPGASPAVSVLRGSTRTPTGSAYPLRSAHVSLQGPPTRRVQSSTLTVGHGKPQPQPQAPGDLALSLRSPTNPTKVTVWWACICGLRPPESPLVSPAPAPGGNGRAGRVPAAHPPALCTGRAMWSPLMGSASCSTAAAGIS